MDQFKFLATFNFEYLLKIYDLVAQLIQKEISHLESKNVNKLSMDEIRNLVFYKQSLDILIESTFLQIYAELEEALCLECEKQLIKKKQVYHALKQHLLSKDTLLIMNIGKRYSTFLKSVIAFYMLMEE